MIGTPLTLKGLIPRNLLSQETFKKFTGKVDQIRNISQSFVQYLLLVHKGIEMYNTSLVKQCQLLQTHVNNDMNDDKRYYLQFSMIFQAVSINFEHFNCTFESNLKQYHVSTCMELDELTTSHLDCLASAFKKYRAMEDLLNENCKKWLKNQKQLSENIKSYNESLVDPRLIYNKEETNKRYMNCEISHQNIQKQQAGLKEKLERLYEQKRGCIYYQNKLIEEYKKSYEFIFQRIVLQAKNTLNLFSNVHKMVVSDIASKKKAFEETRIKPFLYFLPDISNEKHFFDVPPNYKQSTSFPIFLQNPQSIKDSHLKLYSKWLSQYGIFLKQSGQNNKKLLRRVHEFLFQTTKIVEKMSVLIIKEMPIYYERMKKKIMEFFGSKSLDFVKSINATLDTSMRIYEKLIKVLYQKLDNINTLITEDNKTGEMFFKEYNKQLDLFNNDTKLFNILEHRKQIRKAITQKAEVLKFYITTFGQKITKNNELFRVETKSIINQIFESYNEIFIYSSEYQHTYFGAEFVDSLKRVRDSMVISVPIEPINDMIAKELVEVEETERFKYAEFEKIRRPETFLKKEEKEKDAKLSDDLMTVEGSSTNVQDPNYQRSPSFSSPVKKLSIEIDPKQKKNYDFLSKKITLEDGEKFRHTFKCALYDKILLQGKLYVTDLRLCFHSYFNTANLFFGTTFLQIPKKDILKAEKRYNAKIFDNSVSITTINGEVFFTSFFSRDEAFKEITQTFGLKVQEEEPKEEQKGEEDEKEIEAEIQQPQVSKEVKEEVVQPVQQQKQEDDINEQDVAIRTQKLQEVLNKKMNILGTSIIKNASCLYLLKKIFTNQQYTHNNKKYSAFYEFIKESLGEKEISVESWQPDIQTYLNKISIKKDTPLRFNRKCKFNHTLPNSSIPFMPKFCRTEESHRLSIVSNERFIIDLKVTSRGAPYTDTFIVYTREDYKNAEKGVEITASIQIEFIKKSMMQGFIQKQSLKEMKQGVDNYVKFINKIVSSDPELKKKKPKTKPAISGSGQVKKEGEVGAGAGPEEQEVAEQKQEQANEEAAANEQLEEKYAALLKSYGELEKKNLLYRNVIIGLIILSVMALIF